MNASYRRHGEEGFVAHIKEYWFAYIAIIQLVYTFGFCQFTLNNHTDRIVQLETQQKTEEVILSEIKSRLSSIDTSIKYIEQTLSKL